MGVPGDSGLLEQLIGAAQSGILVVAPDGSVVLSNESARRLFDLEEAPSRLPAEGLEFLTSDGAPLPPRRLPWAVALDKGCAVAERLHVRTPHGRDIEVDCVAQPVANGDTVGTVVGVTVAVDAEQAAAELARVREEKRELEQVVAQMPVGCVLLDPDGVVRFENQQMIRIWGRESVGRSATEVVGEMVDLHPEGERHDVSEWPGVRALRGETVRDEDVGIVRPDGTVADLAVSAAPVRGENGAIHAAVVIAADVSERKAAARLTSAVAEIASAVDSTLEPAEVMRRVVTVAARVVGSDMSLLLLKGEHGWTVRESLGLSEDLTGRDFTAEVAPGIARTLQENRALLFPEDFRLDASAARRSSLSIGAALCIPVRMRGEPVGVMAFAQRVGSPAFTHAHLLFAEKLVDLVSLALDNATLMSSTREELARTKVLQEVAAIATTSSELRVVGSRILRTLERLAGMSCGVIHVLAEDGDRLILAASLGLSEEIIELARELPMRPAASLSANALQEGRTVTHEDAPAVRGLKDAVCAFSDSKQRRYAAVPVYFRRAAVGVLLLAFDGRRPFTEAELELFHSIAHTLGQVIENVRLLESEKTARRAATGELEVSNLLLETAETLARPMELQEVLERLAESVANATERSRAIILMTTRGGGIIVGAALGETRLHPGVRMTEETTPKAVWRALQSRSPELADPDAPWTSEEESAQLRRDSVHVGLAVPILFRDRVIGAILTDDPASGQPFTERDIRLVEAIASQAAVVIENAKYYETQHRIAETLQEAMLVMPGHVDGVEFETLYRSATSAARVGGDFYDLFSLAPGRVAIAVGDVSGKGLDAASTTALSRDTLRAHAISGLASAEVMSRTNAALLRFTGPETFVTAIFGTLDLASGAFVYVNAGHPDAYVVGRAGYVRALGGQSPLLGMLDNVSFEEQVSVLAPDDTLFLYTDGVTEARRDKEMFGSSRLATFLGSLKDNAPGHVTRAVFDEVKRFSGGSLRDDVAMLAVRRVAQEAAEG